LGTEARGHQVVIEIPQQSHVFRFDFPERFYILGVLVVCVSNCGLTGFDEILLNLLVPSVIILITISQNEIAWRPYFGCFAHG
jgi:hypothetical protein